MKKLLFFSMALVVACATAMAAPVDVTTAKQKAIEHLQKQVSEGTLKAVGAIDATLIKTEMGEKSEAPVYYIFNTETCYIIVSADDRAEEILAVGDEPLDIENIPENMQVWLDGYAEQLDWLNGNPDAKVERTSELVKDAHLKATSVSPMLTCNWDQGSPYNNQCKFTYNGTTYTCYTGCPATSASMVLYYWKYPTAQVGPLSSYTNTLTIGSSYSTTDVTFTYPALSATTFDWANMKNSYSGSYTTAQATAVATLMRYVGQAEKMMYGVDGSGIYTTQSSRISDMFKSFGYDSGCQVVQKSSYSEANWANLLQTELAEGRPVVYLAVSSSAGGHAFNVDGYNAGENTYHINWGWSGSGNGYCAMNAFSSANSSTGQSGSYTFDQSQQMVIGITPPESAFDPTLITSSASLSFMTSPGTDQTLAFKVSGKNINNPVTLTLNDPSGKFSLSVPDLNLSGSSVTIPASNIGINSSVQVRVTFSTATEGTFTGSITIASSGAESLTVNLNGVADNSGSASDDYLNIAKYTTIDQAGWNSSTYNLNNLYVYEEDTDNGAGWLKMSVFGAWTASTDASFNTGAHGQKWIRTTNTSYTQSSGTSSDGTYVSGRNYAWAANDVHLAYSSYFSSQANTKCFGSLRTSSNTEKKVTFYVTNCNAVKLYGKTNTATNTNHAANPATLKVYNNATGELVGEATPVTTRNTVFNYEVSDLSESAVYRVEASCYMAYFYTIAFSTPLPAIVTDKTGLGYLVAPGESLTKSVNVTGKKLIDDVTATITGDNADLFTLDETTLDATELMLDGVDVNVTFNAPQETGEYEATLTLTCGDLTKEVSLYGQVADKGSAQWEYLDIQQYASLDASGWQNSDDLSSIGITKVYEFTRDNDNLEAWLTIPPSMVALGYMYDNQYWAGFAADDDNINFLSRTWSAADVFKGRSNYFSSQTYAGIGHSSASSSSNTNFAYTYYCVTNCSKFKARIYNYAPTATSTAVNYTYIMIKEMYLDENGNIEDIAEDYLYGTYDVTQNSEITFEYDGLDPEKAYYIVLGSPRAVFEELAFCTPLPELPGKPIDVEADPGVTTADITWTPGKNNESWNLRWRPYVDPINTDRIWDFEDESQFEEFTTVDSDGDGYNWSYATGSSHSGTGVLTSASYISSGALTPDNWLISPKVKLGGTVKFWYCGQDPSYASEVFKVYVYQGDEIPSNVSSFTALSEDITATGDMQEYTANLSSYSGTGYIAIRHYNVTDMFRLNIDDFEVLVPDPVEWNYCNNVASPYTITGLTPETTYETQVQGANSLGVSKWTASTIFTTLPAPTSATLATIESEGVKGASYIISDELVAVYADVDNGLLWCKDQGDASINATSIMSGQIDFMNDATLTGTTGQNGRAWDQSNWVALKFPADQSINSLFSGIEGKKIKAGTVTCKYIDNWSYTLEVLPVDGNYTLTFNGTADYTKNVYCAANFLESNLNLTAESTGAIDGNGTAYFFMNPKIQEVCEITYAMWNGEMFVTPYNTEIQGAFHVDWSRNSVGTPTLQDGKTYRFIAIVSRPAKMADLRGGGEPSDNFVVYPANLSGDGNIVTAINGVFVDGNRQVVGIDYVNAAGMISDKPFQGVNIIVTRYSDGSKTTSKKIFK